MTLTASRILAFSQNISYLRRFYEILIIRYAKNSCRTDHNDIRLLAAAAGGAIILKRYAFQRRDGAVQALVAAGRLAIPSRRRPVNQQTLHRPSPTKVKAGNTGQAQVPRHLPKLRQCMGY